MKTEIILAFVLLAVSTGNAGEDPTERYFSRVSSGLRSELIGKALTMKPLKPMQDDKIASAEEDDKNNLSNKIDAVKYLSQKCGFTYGRNAAGEPQRPTVTCTYAPRDASNRFNGMSAKFDCSFEFTKSDGTIKTKTLKVKYDPRHSEGGGYKEVPQSILGTLTARMLGFYTSTYCPADVICKNCPSKDPWNKNNNSTGEAKHGAVVEFRDVSIEVKQKGYTVEDNKGLFRKKPQGFHYAKELNRNFSGEFDAATLPLIKAQREALTIWLNFVQSGDADVHNSKLMCIKVSAETEKQKRPHCERSAAMINDYGNAWGYAGEKNKMKIENFSAAAVVDNAGTTVTSGAGGNAGASGLAVSNEGIKLFLTMAEAITEAQLEDIFRLAQIEKVSDADVRSWVEAFKKKVQLIKEKAPTESSAL